MIGAIGGGEWCGLCARGLRPEVASRPCSSRHETKVSATDHMADDGTHVRLVPARTLADAGAPLKSALELRLRQREEGGPACRRLLGV